MIDINWLAEQGPCKKFVAGANISYTGGTIPPKKAMYILLAGRVDVHGKSTDGSTQIIASLLKGDVFGGREYFTDIDDHDYIAGIDSLVYIINEESFNDLSWSNPEILFEILRAAYMPLKKAAASHPVSAGDMRAEQAKQAAEQAKQVGAGQITEAKKAEQAAKQANNAAEEAKKAEQARMAAEEAKKAEQARKAEEQAKQAEQAKKAEEQARKAAEEARKVEDAKQAAEQAAEQVRQAAQKAEQAGSSEAALGNAKLVEGSIYLEGHKSYPDITKPEYLPLVFPKEYKCPLCKAAFKDFRVFRSKLYENSPMRSDLRKFYTNFQTEWYDILTCRNCLFSTFHNYFTDPKPIQKTKIEKGMTTARSELHVDFNAERDIDFVFTAHYLAILCADGYPTMGKQIRAKLWGNLSWLYEDVGDREMEIKTATKAAEAYAQVYSESRLTPVQEQITCLSIAGMQHRAGIDDNLKKYLFTAKTLMAGDKMYSKLADEFMYELKMQDE
ncbi:MAG: DUF2225 domain-containing protein [Oscillospiraceae bacterium]|jgi:uncharacterized protein (DUF2225 family)|nr:DUF2225 domain-containing protein [Oscillospiraceae bacterium]